MTFPEACKQNRLFRKRLKELHPDTNGGDYSRVDELTALMKRRHRVIVCPDCKGFKSPRCLRCGLCALRARFYPNALI